MAGMTISSLSFARRMEAALQAADLTEQQANDAGRLLLEQNERLEKRCARTYLLFIGFAAGFTILTGQGVRALSVFGVTLEREQPATVVLVLLAAYFLYQAASATLVAQLVNEVLRVFWQKRLKPFERNEIVSLFEHLTPFRVEGIISRVDYLPFASFSWIWTTTIMIALAGAPTAWFVFASYRILAAPTYGWLVKTGTLLGVWALLIRSAILLVQYIALIVNEAARFALRKLTEENEQKQTAATNKQTVDASITSA